ncbi:glucose-1-phosphate thymidylyltransferase [Haladaptatus litoreus]|uniref:Glucose-1-phosphate thymidylyltransferase n=1 Tax=Haladaptatus litoreus TaxID=553468 RepID=A0A1N7DLM7_9EURY|nr:NDP-sugar synthase [Haladaptatus litoreus]SIR76700.1 glucose-1-phosphate thymidylyltransferase [Haladaptatus litoreus]
MKAIVLAGGYATRLWPITKNRPKMFLPVGDSTVIDRIFAELETDDRITEVFVSTNEHFAEDFREHLDQSDFEKPTLSIEDTTNENEKFGVVGALAQLVDRENISDDLLVIAGDNLISFEISDFIDYFEKQQAATLAAYDVDSREQAKSYGLVELDGEEIIDFQEKPDKPKSTLVSIACYAFPQATVPLLEEYLDEDNNPDEPGWFIQWLQSQESVYAYTFDEAWFDIGTPDSYLEAVQWELGTENYIADSATVNGTDLGENVHIMANAEIVDSTISNSIVFPDSTIEGAIVEDTIIDKETEIQTTSLRNALIGAHSIIKQ